MGPISMKLEAEKKYLFCTCGKSKDTVLCDGAHRDTRFKPLHFSVKESKNYHLCTCKKSNNLPFCDGTHASV
ncbi:CDGSH iron-sulfur domain-containing protein [Sulfurospirillum sp. 1612]|uniref:CDGSH iron-sulfur domain-containing protein n=1 Tax=Sulfurospirillum sp. 1612 TaxID=3094835 RepID=UPI002F927253